MHQLERLIEIDRRIRAKRCPHVADLALEFEVSRRQVYLDRQKLIEMGAPLSRDAAGDWIYSEPSWVLPSQFLREGELLAFFLSVEIARSQGNFGLQEPLQNAVDKIARSLGNIISVDLNALRDSTSYSLSPAARVDADLHAQLCRAIAARRKLKMNYFTASRGQKSERIVHPYHLYMARGEWLLIAHDESKSPDDNPIRCFNIARISRLQELDARFQIAPDFDVQRYVREMFNAERGDTLHRVSVHFDPFQARYIRERKWHPDQTIEEGAEGELTLHFPASGLNEIARWVLSYGRHARVVAPPELRDLVSSHVAAMGEIYADSEGEL